MVDKRSRPMARGERRKQLLQVARELVAADGIAALTMTALSERAEVAKPVVYSHFPNRHQVAIALLDEHFSTMAKYARERIAAAKTLDEYLELLIDSGFEFEAASDIPVRKITNGFSAGDEVNQAFHRHEEKFRHQWRKLLELQSVPRDVADIAAHACMGMMNNAIFNVASPTNKRRARETVKKLVLSAVHALLPAQTNGKPFDPIFNLNTLYGDDGGAPEKNTRKKRDGGAKARKAAVG